jgi:hypothetical protein
MALAAAHREVIEALVGQVLGDVRRHDLIEAAHRATGVCHDVLADQIPPYVLGEAKAEFDIRLSQELAAELGVIARLKHFDIPLADIIRWEAVARRLEPTAPALLVEVSRLRTEPCIYCIERAANAARFAASPTSP